jgi:hypothetical protein
LNQKNTRACKPKVNNKIEKKTNVIQNVFNIGFNSILKGWQKPHFDRLNVSAPQTPYFITLPASLPLAQKTGYEKGSKAGNHVCQG